MNTSRVSISAVAVALFALAMGFAASGVAAQNAATVMSEDVGLANQDDVATSSIEISADEGVSAADTRVSVDTNVVEIVNATGAQTGTGTGYNVDVSSDGSYAWINYTNIQGSQSDFTVGEVDLQAQTDGPNSSALSLETNNYNNASYGEFATVNTDEGTATIGSTEFSLSGLSPQQETVVKGGLVNATVDVENTGELNGSQTLEAVVDGTVLDNETVALGVGGSDTVGLSIDTGAVGFGVYNYTIRSENDEDTGNLRIVEDLVPANVTSTDAVVRNVGDTGNSTVKLDAGKGLAAADVTVSVDTSVARITDIRKGSDVGSGGGVLFEVKNRTNGSATIEYTNLNSPSIQNFSLAHVELELVANDSEANIQLEADNFRYTKDGEGVPYADVVEYEGTITDALFSQPLLSDFAGPPTNTGELDPTLYEDLSGDGDGTSVTQTVKVFGELIRGNDLGLTDDQARVLNWDSGSPETEVTVSDMVSLFGEQIRAP
jgi:hypothetical protein